MLDWNGPLITFGGIRIQTDDRVYGPDDDTFLLEKHAEVRPDERVLEVGCGTGFTAVSCALKGGWVTASDINPLAVELARHNALLNGVEVDAREADMFKGTGGPFDVVLFNPPYLPTNGGDVVPGPINAAFDGGPAGDSLILRFLEGLPKAMAKHGRAFVVVSSLTDRGRRDGALEGRLNRETVGTADAGMERLEVWRLKRAHQ